VLTLDRRLIMLAEMKNIAEECIKHPRRISIWSDAEGRYICPDNLSALATAPSAAIQAPLAGGAAQRVPTINPVFKLVFFTAAAGTVFFTLLCVVLHLVTDGAPPPLMEKLIQSMLDLVKVGFGAIVGLLGGKALDQPLNA
jgi:hypothetical protein